MILEMSTFSEYFFSFEINVHVHVGLTTGFFFLSGSSASFKRVFENPIVASRQPNASPEDIELGAERGSELSRITKLFVLRRSQEINTKYLPPKCKQFLF